MAAFLVRSDRKTVLNTVQGLLLSQGFTILRSQNSLTSDNLSCVQRAKGARNRIEALISIRPREEMVLISTSFRCGVLFRLPLMSLVAFIGTISILLALYLNEFVMALQQTIAFVLALLIVVVLGRESEYLLSQFSWSSLLLSVTCLMIGVAFKTVSRVGASGTETLARYESEFREGLEKHFHVRLIAFAHLQPLPAIFSIFFVLAPASALGIILYSIHLWVFYLDYLS